MSQRIRLIGVLVLALLASACATTGETATENDPYEGFNRRVFAFNQALDENVALPAARAYVQVTPPPVRSGVSNFLANMKLPVTFANDLLQGEITRAGQTLGRFAINTTIGVGGVGDVATRVGIQPHTEDFGQTLAVYGASEGPYLVLPVLGPSNPRDAVGYVVDIFFDPFTWVTIRDKMYWSAGRTTIDLLDIRQRNIETLESVERGSVDYYASLRSLYRQQRTSQINNGEMVLEDLPNF